jgi:hypothetical protein
VTAKRPVDVLLKVVALAATALCLYCLIELYLVIRSAQSIDVVAGAVASTLKGLTIGIVILIAALIARLVLRRRARTTE